MTHDVIDDARQWISTFELTRVRDGGLGRAGSAVEPRGLVRPSAMVLCTGRGMPRICRWPCMALSSTPCRQRVDLAGAPLRLDADTAVLGSAAVGL